MWSQHWPVTHWQLRHLCTLCLCGLACCAVDIVYLCPLCLPLANEGRIRPIRWRIGPLVVSVLSRRLCTSLSVVCRVGWWIWAAPVYRHLSLPLPLLLRPSRWLSCSMRHQDATSRMSIFYQRRWVCMFSSDGRAVTMFLRAVYTDLFSGVSSLTYSSIEQFEL